MEYSLPGPVVALLQEEKASLAPKAYFISSGKKSIKITLVYAKNQNQNVSNEVGVEAPSEGAHRKKPRHGVSSTQGKKSAGLRRQGSHKMFGSPPSLRRNDPLPYQSDAEQVCSTPEFNMGTSHDTGASHSGHRSHMSTVDSGHPPSSTHPSTSGSDGSHRQVDEDVSVSESEGEEERDEEERGEREGESESSGEPDKPRTPGREIAVAESSLGPGETPAASRDEMWQTWTRIPRSQAVHKAHKFLAAPTMTSDRRSISPSVSHVQRNSSSGASQRRHRLQEGVSWEGSGNL